VNENINDAKEVQTSSMYCHTYYVY